MKKIAIDLGGTNIRCAVLNEQYEIECLEKERTVHTGSLEDNIKQIVKLIQNCPCIKDEKTTIGIGVPGVVNEEGILKYISNIPELEGIPFCVGKDREVIETMEHVAVQSSQVSYSVFK